MENPDLVLQETGSRPTYSRLNYVPSRDTLRQAAISSFMKYLRAIIGNLCYRGTAVFRFYVQCTVCLSNHNFISCPIFIFFFHHYIQFNKLDSVALRIFYIISTHLSLFGSLHVNYHV